MKNLEYATADANEIRKFTREWIEERIKAQKENSTLTPDELQNIEKKEKTLNKKLNDYYKYFDRIIEELKA